MKTWGLLMWMLASALAACGGDDEFSDCRIGELTGTWRSTYDETDGTCGPIPDETSVFDPGAGDPNCTYNTDDISGDMCRADLDFECPLTDGQGSQHWVVVITQVAEDELNGTGTLQATHPDLGTCRSTYDIEIVRL